MMPYQPAAIIGVVAGAIGILYGWKARYFKTGVLGLATKPSEKFVPRWQDRVLVISICAVVFIASLVSLLTNR